MERWKDDYPDSAGLTPTASRSNTPEEIAALSVWQERLAFAFTEKDRQFYIQGMHWKGQQSPAAEAYRQTSLAYPNHIDAYLATKNNMFSMTTVIGSLPIGSDSPDSLAIEITAQLPNGDPFTYRYIYEEFVLDNGATIGLWRHE
jgi:hypothetical protein